MTLISAVLQTAASQQRHMLGHVSAIDDEEATESPHDRR